MTIIGIYELISWNKDNNSKIIEEITSKTIITEKEDDKNTILYAYSRLDKTMVGSLSKVFRSEWHTNKDNHIIRISTESENTLWQIFSVYKIEEESYYITTEFRNDEKYTEFLNTLKSRSLYNFNTSLNVSDKILTLSTCYDDNIRTVVHAKLIKRSVKE